MQRFVLIFLAVSLLARPSVACTCTPEVRPFLLAAQHARYVVVARVVGHRRSWPLGRLKYMDLAVETVLVGLPDLRTLVLTGGKSDDCWHAVTGFSVGSRWVLAITASSTASGLFVSRCEESVLSFDGTVATGIIRASPFGGALRESLSLEDLSALLMVPRVNAGRGLTPACSGLASLAADARR